MFEALRFLGGNLKENRGGNGNGNGSVSGNSEIDSNI